MRWKWQENIKKYNIVFTVNTWNFISLSYVIYLYVSMQYCIYNINYYNYFLEKLFSIINVDYKMYNIVQIYT